MIMEINYVEGIGFIQGGTGRVKPGKRISRTACEFAKWMDTLQKKTICMYIQKM